MSQMMMFVGVGGSGAKTLMYLHDQLSKYLESINWQGPFPAGWQFVALDLPPQPDQAERINHALPNRDYRGIASIGSFYPFYDSLLADRAELRREFYSWRPNPDAVEQLPWKGAGQYRSIGRTVVLSNFPAVRLALDDAVSKLDSPDTLEEFNRLLIHMGENPVVGQAEPLVFVVGSMAGGSGSGVLLDVCDLLRVNSAAHAWLDVVNAVLYTPEVFNHLNELQRAGVEANSLAFMNELVSAWYDHDRELPHHRAAGHLDPIQSHAGPRYSFLVGKSNGQQFSLGDDFAVYQTVAQCLKALTLDGGLQSSFQASIQGNWGQATTDTNPLHPPARPRPVSALGFSKLTLGRDRFATYAAERLSRSAVEMLLERHRILAGAHLDPKADASLITRDQLVDLVVNPDLVASFLADARLEERTEERNQVLEQLLPPATMEAAIATSSAAILKGARGNLRGNEPGNKWWDRADAQLGPAEQSMVNELTELIDDNTRTFTEEAPGRLIKTVGSYLANYGVFVTIRLLEQLDAALKDVVERELPAERDTAQGLVDNLGPQLRKDLGGVLEKTIRFDNPRLKEAMESFVTRRPRNKAHVVLRNVAIPLLSDLRTALVRPLRDELERVADDLQELYASSRYNDWASGPVPDHLKPATNEVLLEPITVYEQAFDRLLGQTVGRGDSLTEAVRQLFEDDLLRTADIPAMALFDLSPWRPSVGGRARQGMPVVARMALSADQLMARARSWMLHDTTQGLGYYLTDSIDRYLEAPQASDRERDRRARDFEAKFDQAVRMGQPLVAQDRQILASLHGIRPTAAGLPPASLAMSPVPISTSNPARSRADGVLSRHGVADANIAAYYSTDTSASEITIVSAAAEVHPLAFRSYTSEIASKWSTTNGSQDVFGKWRQSRRLMESIPLPSDIIREMITGWMVGTCIGRVEVRDLGGHWAATIADESARRLAFPEAGPCGPAIVETELLGVVLEAYAITELLDADKGVGIAPYVALRDLGRPGTLSAWAAAQPPSTDDQGQVVAAVHPLLEELIGVQAHYESMLATPPTVSFQQTTRDWDLAPEIVRSTAKLRDELEAVVMRPKARASRFGVGSA